MNDPEVKEEWSMIRLRVLLLTGIAVACLLLLGDGPTFSQETKAGDLDEKARKLIGTYQYSVDNLMGITTIGHEKGKWSISGIFKDRGKPVGAFEGMEVQYEDGVLTYKQKYLTKP